MYEEDKLTLEEVVFNQSFDDLSTLLEMRAALRTYRQKCLKPWEKNTAKSQMLYVEE